MTKPKYQYTVKISLGNTQKTISAHLNTEETDENKIINLGLDIIFKQNPSIKDLLSIVQATKTLIKNY